jgi:colicin import membrane protein
MPRKLKTYQTSIGFFDLAIAAPSMKAALEAWGSEANLFHQGFAKEADDPAIVAATIARPGVVLKRAVGSNDSFSDHAKLPRDLTGGVVTGTARRHPRKTQAPPLPRKVDDKAARQAAVAYARDRKRRDSERRSQEAAQEAERKRRAQAIAKAETVLDDAKRTHAIKNDEIAAERSALDRRSEAEETRWTKQRAKLEAALRQVKE